MIFLQNEIFLNKGKNLFNFKLFLLGEIQSIKINAFLFKKSILLEKNKKILEIILHKNCYFLIILMHKFRKY
jgi:hypothetical protein